MKTRQMRRRKTRKDFSEAKHKCTIADYFAKQLVEKGISKQQFIRLMRYKK